MDLDGELCASHNRARACLCEADLAGQLSVGDVELAEHVAWGQGHLAQVRRVPEAREGAQAGHR